MKQFMNMKLNQVLALMLTIAALATGQTATADTDPIVLKATNLIIVIGCS